MAILNGLINKMKGSAGQLTFKRLNGQTVVSERPTKISNPRTEAQQRQRTRWTSGGSECSGGGTGDDDLEP